MMPERLALQLDILLLRFWGLAKSLVLRVGEKIVDSKVRVMLVTAMGITKGQDACLWLEGRPT